MAWKNCFLNVILIILLFFRRYCAAIRVAKSLINRTTLPASFSIEVRKKLIEMSAPSIPNMPANSLFLPKDSSNSMSSLNSFKQSNFELSSISSLSVPSHADEEKIEESDKWLYEDHGFFTAQYDAQLLQWFNRR